MSQLYFLNSLKSGLPQEIQGFAITISNERQISTMETTQNGEWDGQGTVTIHHLLAVFRGIFVYKMG